MKLIFRQKIFSWFGSYNINDEKENIKYKVKGKLSFSHKFEIYDKEDQYLGMIKQKMISIFPKFEIYLGKEYVGELKQKVSFFKPKFTLSFKDWKVVGDVWGWNYEVIDGKDNIIITAKKKIWNLVDVYEIDITDPKNEVYSLMIVLAIFAAKEIPISFYK